MKRFLLFIVLLLSLKCNCQTQKNINIPNNSYINKEWLTRAIKYLELRDLKTIDDQFVYRFWIESKWIVELSSTKNNKLKLIAITYISGDYKSDTLHGGLIYKTKIYSDSISNIIYNYLALNKINSLRDASFIPKYKFGFDGYTVDIEYTKPEVYKIVSYWVPEEQKKIKEAKIICNLKEKLEKELCLQESFDLIIKHLPPGSYSSGMMDMIIK